MSRGKYIPLYCVSSPGHGLGKAAHMSSAQHLDDRE